MKKTALKKRGPKPGSGKYLSMVYARISPKTMESLKFISDELTVSQHVRRAVEIYLQDEKYRLTKK